MSKAPRIEIRYCIGCRWLLRAAWLAQEILTTFEAEIGEVALLPDSTGGVFEIRVGDTLIWSRAEQHRFPDAKEIKQAVRNIVVPGRDLGHVDH